MITDLVDQGFVVFLLAGKILDGQQRGLLHLAPALFGLGDGRDEIRRAAHRLDALSRKTILQFPVPCRTFIGGIQDRMVIKGIAPLGDVTLGHIRHISSGQSLSHAKRAVKLRQTFPGTIPPNHVPGKKKGFLI